MTGDRHWFKTDKIGEGVTAIDDCGKCTMYLIEGSEKAVLLDTGWGVGDLPELLSTLTALPITVLHTHAHPDHVSGSYQFDEVMVSDGDLPLFLKCFEPEYRRIKYESFLKEILPDSRSAERWIHAKPKKVGTVTPGTRIDLGNRKIVILSLPGHTYGSIALLDANDRLLFTGDMILSGTIWMHLDVSTALRVFLESIQNLLRIKQCITALLPSHGKTPLDPAVIDELIAGVKEILNLKRKGEPVKTFAGDGLLCRFDSCGIVYAENKLF